MTIIVKDETPAGSGGGGSQLQSTLGIASTGPVVVCASVVAMLYVQSYAMMFPGAVDVLPLKVQLSVAPLFASVQVSD